MWMFFFEAYFGLCIKFVNPACLTFLFFQNLVEDLKNPYGEQPEIMQVLSSILIYIAVMITLVPMFSCDYPEGFEHNVNLEFAADQIYSQGLDANRQYLKSRLNKGLAGKFKNSAMMKMAKKQGAAPASPT